MGKSAGAAPDFKGAAEQTSRSSQDAVNRQTQANRPNVSTPWAQQQWTMGPDGTPQMSTGFQGGFGQAADNLTGQLGNSLSSPFSFGQFGKMGTGDDARNQAISANFGSASSRLNPLWDRREDMSRTRLLNQGLSEDSEAYRNSMSELGRDRNDAYGNALNSAIMSGTAAGDSVFKNNLAGRQQNIVEALRQRQLPLEELGQMQNFLAMPGFNTAGQGQGADYFGATGATGNWNMQDAQMQNKFWGDLAGGVMGMAGSAAKFSDERVKTDIVRLPMEAMPGVPFASWKWAKGFEGSGPTFGVIAQDLEKVAPHLVHRGADGFLRVDYSFLNQE